MRGSAVLTDSSVRLWDLAFPADRVELTRTRAAYVHLDNLIAFSKRDRDGKVNAYLACYRPDETVLLFFLGGDVVNAAVMAPGGRRAISIAEAMEHLRAEPERSELAFHCAGTSLLSSMWSTCTQPSQDLGIDPTSPKTVFENLLARKWSGLIELISNGRVSYLTVKDGRYASGVFSEQLPGEDAKAYLSRMFTSKPPEPLPRITVQAFALVEKLPLQAAPALVKQFRTFVWELIDLAEKDDKDSDIRAERIRHKLSPKHEALKSVGGPRDGELNDPVVEPHVFTEALAQWTSDFLGELEVMHPGIAPRLLKQACREQRFQFQAAGFFDRLPWKIEW